MLTATNYKYRNFTSSKVACFISVDPLQFKYPELTPFQYASNRPISGTDLDGAGFFDKSDDNGNREKALFHMLNFDLTTVSINSIRYPDDFDIAHFSNEYYKNINNNHPVKKIRYKTQRICLFFK